MCHGISPINIFVLCLLGYEYESRCQGQGLSVNGILRGPLVLTDPGGGGGALIFMQFQANFFAK